MRAEPRGAPVAAALTLMEHPGTSNDGAARLVDGAGGLGRFAGRPASLSLSDEARGAPTVAVSNPGRSPDDAPPHTR